MSSEATAVAREPFSTPEPWVPVATAPATEMCGSEARLPRAQPGSLQLRRHVAVCRVPRHASGARLGVDLDRRRQVDERHEHTVVGVGDVGQVGEAVPGAQRAHARRRGHDLLEVLDRPDPLDACPVRVVAGPVRLRHRASLPCAKVHEPSQPRGGTVAHPGARAVPSPRHGSLVADRPRPQGALMPPTSPTSLELTAAGLLLEVVTAGAAVRRLVVTDDDGATNVVLGHEDPMTYAVDGGYLGATIGRFGNRLAGARFTLDGAEHTVTANEGGNALHGGLEGFDRRDWTVEEQGASHVRLGLHSPDGDQGFPGALDVTVTYSVAPGVVRIDYSATSDADTVVSLTNHTYFNLDGEGSGAVDAHQPRRVGRRIHARRRRADPHGRDPRRDRNTLRPAASRPARRRTGSRRRAAHPRQGLRPQPRRDRDRAASRRNAARELRPHPGDHQ